MASAKHDFIVSAIARKIRCLGYQIIYLDGRYQDIDMKKPDIPPSIISHRPDIVGVMHDSSFIIGEAKTELDLTSTRTKKQIADFTSILKMNSSNKLILGIPMNSRVKLQNVISELNISNNTQIEILCIPEELLPDEKNVQF